jgi:hypothetical protein
VTLINFPTRAEHAERLKDKAIQALRDSGYPFQGHPLLDTVRTGAWLDRQAFPELTAAEAVELGECSGACMVANSEKSACTCSCYGTYHGVLSSAVIAPASEGRPTK